MPTTVTISGFKEFADKCKNISENMVQELDEAAKFAAATWEERAKLDAPKDVGFLAGGISSTQIRLGEYEIVSAKEYSAYMEWGTKGKVHVPAELSAYASQFKGKGVGDYYDFLNAILDWVKRKGLSTVINSYTGKKVGGKAAKENLVVLAEAIALSILKKGVNPHPFFFIQKPLVEKQFLSDIRQIMEVVK